MNGMIVVEVDINLFNLLIYTYFINIGAEENE